MVKEQAFFGMGVCFLRLQVVLCNKLSHIRS